MAERPALTGLFDADVAPAFTMIAGVLAALVWSLAYPSSYERLVNVGWSSRLMRDVELSSPHEVAASALMTIFFFGVGLELARERRRGALAHLRHATAPVLAAIGGMSATALLAVAAGTLTHEPALRHGWGIPMATDIAFTLGVLALVGRRVPTTLRLFLLALAVADDVLSVLVLSVDGTTKVRVIGVLAGAVVAAVAFVTSRHHVTRTSRVLILVALWAALTWANVEPALAGVVAGLLAPYDDDVAPRLERATNRWSVAVVLPLYALVSCGVEWTHLHWGGTTTTIVVAVVVVRIVGKVLGITAGVALARRIGLPPPTSISGPVLRAGAVLCAIGFTVPLLFAQALFSTSGATYGAFTVGLLGASVVAAVIGALLLHHSLPSGYGRINEGGA